MSVSVKWAWLLWVWVGWLVAGQVEVQLKQPSLVETDSYTLRRTYSNLTNLTNTVPFIQNYTINPQVVLSLASLYSFQPLSRSSFVQEVVGVSHSGFVMNYSLWCLVGVVNCTLSQFAQVDIVYLAFDYSTYPYIQPLTFNHTMDPAIVIANQYYQMNYMQAIPPGHGVQLTCLLAGFDSLLLSGQPSLYIDAVQKNSQSYLLNVRFTNLLVGSLQVVRLLIDETAMNASWVDVNSLTCETGTVYHSADPLVIENNPTPDYVPFGIFYGVKGFTGWNLTTAQMPYIFNNSVPRVSVYISYTLFLTKSCPTNSMYVTAENLCYSLGSPFYYQPTPVTLQACPYSCYQCVGPLSTQCKSCAEGWNRYLNGGRCRCKVGFYDPGGPICLNCTDAMSGCYTCSSATNCLTCLPNCTAISFTPIYCDCPLHVVNSSTNCNLTYYYEFDYEACTCLPQTYYSMDAKLCLPCALGCYICVSNATFCLACIDAYQLVEHSCLYFFTSYALLGLTSINNSPWLRCLRWDRSNTICLQRCKRYYYQANCYYSCPVGTFNISFPWKTCQPCKIYCEHCFNFTICYKCAAEYNYFNSTILTCSPCSPHCRLCDSKTNCSLCDDPYTLSAGYCLLNPLALPACADACLFCVKSSYCQYCKAPYFLNASSGVCIPCGEGLKVAMGGVCEQICGDGKIINSACDDGNTISGDGCDSSCGIQTGYECVRTAGRSYCWSMDTVVQWKIYPHLGENKISIAIWSDGRDLSDVLVDLECSFHSSVTSMSPQNKGYAIILEYKQSILLNYPTNQTNTPWNNGSKTCTVTLNKLANYSLTMNAYPESLLIDYTSTLQSILVDKKLMVIGYVCVLLQISFALLGMAPLASFVTVRPLLLMTVSFLDYSQCPSNSYTPLPALLQLLFVGSQYDSTRMVYFDSPLYESVLWKVGSMYVGIVLLHEMVVRVVLRISSSMDWKALNLVMKHICDNKAVIYQSIYLSYEVIVVSISIKTMMNTSEASAFLIAMATLHLLIFVGSKFHFYFTRQSFTATPSFLHSMVVDHIHNFSLAILLQFSTEKASYAALLMLLYSTYSLMSIAQNNPPSPFTITLTFATWHYRVNLGLLIIVQVAKNLSTWRGLFLSPEQYEAWGSRLGLVMGVSVYLTMLTGGVMGTISQLLRLSEIKHQHSQQLAQSDQISVDLPSNIQ